jgi:hypothetical protein
MYITGAVEKESSGGGGRAEIFHDHWYAMHMDFSPWPPGGGGRSGGMLPQIDSLRTFLRHSGSRFWYQLAYRQ